MLAGPPMQNTHPIARNHPPTTTQHLAPPHLATVLPWTVTRRSLQAGWGDHRAAAQHRNPPWMAAPFTPVLAIRQAPLFQKTLVRRAPQPFFVSGGPARAPRR